jgi:hypothetical protein
MMRLNQDSERHEIFRGKSSTNNSNNNKKYSARASGEAAMAGQKRRNDE